MSMTMAMTRLIALALIGLGTGVGCERSEAENTSPGASAGPGEASEGATDDGDDHDPDHAYCDCMLVHCHDDFHEEWGESDLEATLGCRDEAAMLPRKGEPTLQGNVLECRLGHCEAAQADPTQCDAALGAAPCE